MEANLDETYRALRLALVAVQSGDRTVADALITTAQRRLAVIRTYVRK